MAEGNYLIVDKNLVELIALAVLAAFAGRGSIRLRGILAGLTGGKLVFGCGGRVSPFVSVTHPSFV